MSRVRSGNPTVDLHMLTDWYFPKCVQVPQCVLPGLTVQAQLLLDSFGASFTIYTAIIWGQDLNR